MMFQRPPPKKKSSGTLLSQLSDQVTTPLASGQRAMGIMRKYVLRANKELLQGCLEFVEGELGEIERAKSPSQQEPENPAPSKIVITE